MKNKGGKDKVRVQNKNSGKLMKGKARRERKRVIEISVTW